MTGSAVSMWTANNSTQRQVANASGWIREHQSGNITSDDIATLLALDAPSVAQRADRLLLELARRFPSIGMSVRLDYRTAADLLGVSWSESLEEIEYLVWNHLVENLGYLSSPSRSMGGFIGQISPHGFRHLDETRHSRIASNIGFCAMWFDEAVKPIWTNAIEPAIRDAGYEPKRIDDHEHNNRIDDEILAMLRRSKFVVADFTGQRGGVYFESGFALGLGLTVVWTCSKEELEADKIHFDNRQYSFVTWEKDKMDDFRSRLQNRIEATIGRGAL